MTDELNPLEMLAQMRAAADQLKESNKEIAQAVGIMYKELIAQGFIEEQAERIVTAWMLKGMEQASAANSMQPIIDAFLEQFGGGNA